MRSTRLLSTQRLSRDFLAPRTTSRSVYGAVRANRETHRVRSGGRRAREGNREREELCWKSSSRCAVRSWAAVPGIRNYRCRFAVSIIIQFPISRQHSCSEHLTVLSLCRRGSPFMPSIRAPFEPLRRTLGEGEGSPLVSLPAPGKEKPAMNVTVNRHFKCSFWRNAWLAVTQLRYTVAFRWVDDAARGDAAVQRLRSGGRWEATAPLLALHVFA